MNGHLATAHREMYVHCLFLRAGQWSVLLLALTLLVMGSAPVAYGQAQGATLTGTVTDQSSAVIPNATVILKEEGSGAIRRTVANADGFFTIPSIDAGRTYTVIIEAQGFAKWERKSIHLSSGDRVNIPDIVLTLASVAQQVSVEARPEAMIPVDSGEKSHVITARQIQNLSVLGRSADELLKILPGVVYTNPSRPGEPAGLTVKFNEGIGNYNVSGSRNTAIVNISDGADVIDPGCNCGSAVTHNMDMVQEVKVQTANFNAEFPRGPVVFSSVSKAGASVFHGEAYTYFRQSKFNSRDWRNNFFDTKKPTDSFYYPGFNIGGPLTKNRQKAFFFAGIEIMRQNVDLGVRPAVVPTAAMRQGDFSDSAYIKSLNGDDVHRLPGYDGESGTDNANWSGNALTPGMISGGVINPAAIDPGGQVLLNLYPLPNQDPAKSKGYNFTANIINPQHRHQELTRLDFNISDSTKLYTRFNHEYEANPYPYTLWWYNSNDVPTPGKLFGAYNTWSSSTSLVKVLNPTTTNEVIFAATYWNMPHKFRDPDKISRSGLGYPYKGLFKNDYENSVPSMTDWGSGVADMVQPGGLFKPTISGRKLLLSVTDNFTKVAGTHMLKFGGYFDLITNNEPFTGQDHGYVSPTWWGGNSSGNAYADLLLGRIGDYSENTVNPTSHLRKKEFAGYAQDSWKATRRLTLDMGLRFQHIQRMYDAEGKLAGFDPARYDPNVPFSGIVAPHLGDKVSKGISPNPGLLVSPRFGFAYDLTGKGNTVIRGGGGVFYSHGRHAQVLAAMNHPPLVQSVDICCGTTLAAIDAIDPSTQTLQSSITVLDLKDNHLPTTYDWSLTLSHRLPSATVVEASYVGSTSIHQKSCNNCGFNNLNRVPEGAMFGFPLGDNPNAYRPYQQYGKISLLSHELSQNYHSLQVTANRQTGRVNYSVAYTFSKAMGTGGEEYNVNTDSFDRRHRSYGPLGYDRTHILSVAYTVFLPDPARSNRFLKQLLNGWQTSGITQFMSGNALQPDIRLTGEANAVQGPGDPNPGKAVPLESKWIAGTDGTSVQAVLTCDPRKGVSGDQFANPACFGAPLPGANGMYQYPYMKHPGFQNHDLSIFKNFQISEHKKFQFRFSMFNFVNHPLPFFEGADSHMDLHYESDKDANGNPIPGTHSLRTSDVFGKTQFKRGRRLMQFAIKFFF